VSWNLSCTDWAARLKSGQTPIRDGLPLDLTEGGRAVAVYNKLRLADVPGTPTLADASGDWFRDIVRTLFGSMDPIARQRMIRELFILVPKKN
jgi:phage terminase large subunit-like protein